MKSNLKSFSSKAFFGILAFVLFLPALPALAASDEGAGTVIAARRQAWADRTQEKSNLASKSPVYAGDLLVTNEVGRLQVLFKDDSVFMMAPESQARVTEYLYGESGKHRFNLDLARGMTRIISGRITEEGGVIGVKTSEASVGIHGTDTLIRANPNGSTEVAVLQGSKKKPVRVCPSGWPLENCIPLEPFQGVVISGDGLQFMNEETFGNFTASGNFQDGGVQPPANGTPDAGPSLPPIASIPTLPGGPGILPPDLANDPTLNVAATNVIYAGNFNFMESMLNDFVTMDSGTYALTVGNLLESPTITGVSVEVILKPLEMGGVTDALRGSISMNAQGNNLGSVELGGSFNLVNPGVTNVNIPELLVPLMLEGPYDSTVSGKLPAAGSGLTSIPGITWEVEIREDPFMKLQDIPSP